MESSRLRRSATWVATDFSCSGRSTFAGRESRVEFDQPMAWLIGFRDGRVLRMEMFPDHSEALEAAGLTE